MHSRDATLADASAINSVSRALGYTPLSDTEAQAQLEALMASPDDRVYVAEVDQRVVGWVHVFRARRVASLPFHEIGGLAVDPACRRQGIGRALVQHACSQFEGPVRVRCRDDRTETHSFYEALGFTATKGQRVFTR